jgi:hypothetical protein
MTFTKENITVNKQRRNMKATIATLITVITATMTAPTANAQFESGELNLSLFGGWVDKDDSKLAPGAGLSYFLTRHIGVGAFTHWDNFDGKFFDNVSAEGHFRLPLGELPLAPYGLVALGYSFETEETFESFGGGAEWRFNDKWGVFGDARWQINNDTDDGIGLRAGVRLGF